jgi:hypothetical protein
MMDTDESKKGQGERQRREEQVTKSEEGRGISVASNSLPHGPHRGWDRWRAGAAITTLTRGQRTSASVNKSHATCAKHSCHLCDVPAKNKDWDL